MFILYFKANDCGKNTSEKCLHTKIEEDSAQTKPADACIGFGYIN